MAVDIALGLASDGGGFSGKLRLVLGAVFVLSSFLGGPSLPTQTFRLRHRMQRLPHLLTALDVAGALRSGQQYGAIPARWRSGRSV